VVRPALDLLLTVYFDQDWDIDASSADAIVDLFLIAKKASVIRAARDEAAEPLRTTKTEDALGREDARAAQQLPSQGVPR
jgi:CdiI immunity protein